MAAQVEAKSLSAINFLAANPPQYPNNPTEDKHEALVLYISRVPGTRDVILSPFKPQRKNVTGEDVANSLYYVHLDLPSDEQLAPPKPIGDRATPRASGESARSDNDNGSNANSPATPAIPRKPLPANARVPNLETRPSAGLASTAPAPAPVRPVGAGGPNVPSGSNSPEEQPSPQKDRFPPQAHPPPAGHATQSLSVPIPRRPLGPRPMGRPATPEKELPPTPDAFAPPSPLTRHAPDLPPHSGNRPRPSIITDESAQVATTPLPMSRSPSPPKRRNSFTPFALTLIRRDPTSGNQWNIGKVSSLQSSSLPFDENENVGGHDDRAPHPHHQERGYPAIDIRLEASGYAKFRGFPMRPGIDAHRPGSAVSLPGSRGDPGDRERDMANFLRGVAQQQQQQQQQQAQASVSAVVEEGFSRQVVMAYSKTWTSNIRHAFRRRERSDTARSGDGDDDAPITTPSPVTKLSGHGRHDSTASAGSVESAGAGAAPGDTHEGGGRESPQPLITQPGPGLKAKGYVFSSPWDGRCEFRTGNGGRSLRCRHILTSHGGGFNPLVLAQGIRDGNVLHSGHRRGRSLSSSITGAAAVSELRFNLPSADLFRSKEDRERAVRELHGHLDRLVKTHRRNRSGDESDGWEGGGARTDSDDEEEPIFDLSLGKERAGGGNRGKRAKLGKLIVYDEGLKMLDLVVAANMGVWWGAWERSF
ncbi:Oxidoreductase-like protein [Pleurostoma richardsiae]|uniref:Oxidoreductase-like protein n=1 Tax=Pleurostoma richardsiae TaxID=41990 RepID=A0AA38VQT9_9PEZI|nr:Oxidoreductase-like protein [Pleurostoma richardsiae]